MFDFLKPKTTIITVGDNTSNEYAKITQQTRPPLPEKTIVDIEHKTFFDELKPKKNNEMFKIRPKGADDIERGEYVFRKVYGFDDIKFNIYRGLTSPDPYLAIIKGKAASAKSLMMFCIVEHFNNVIHLTAKSTSAGLIEKLKENPETKILIIEEFDRWNKNDIDDLRSLFSDGVIQKSLKYEDINLKIEGLKVLITTNGLVKLDDPILSRFLEYHLPEYTDEEFKEVCAYCLPDFRQEVIHGMAEVLMAHNMKDVRECLLMSRMLRPSDSDRVIEKIVSTHIKYSTTKSKDVDWNKKR